MRQARSMPGRLPSEVSEVLTEMRDAVSLLLAETEFERSQRLEQMWGEVEQGNTTHAEFRAKWNAMLDDIDAIAVISAS